MHLRKQGLVSPSGMVETPRLQARKKNRVGDMAAVFAAMSQGFGFGNSFSRLRDDDWHSKSTICVNAVSQGPSFKTPRLPAEGCSVLTHFDKSTKLDELT
jgi:hypothetical protein